jgi:hypothetical protein
MDRKKRKKTGNENVAMRKAVEITLEDIPAGSDKVIYVDAAKRLEVLGCTLRFTKVKYEYSEEEEEEEKPQAFYRMYFFHPLVPALRGAVYSNDGKLKEFSILNTKNGNLRKFETLKELVEAIAKEPKGIH